LVESLFALQAYLHRVHGSQTCLASSNHSWSCTLPYLVMQQVRTLDNSELWKLKDTSSWQSFTNTP
jgi:hypothetical protein